MLYVQPTQRDFAGVFSLVAFLFPLIVNTLLLPVGLSCLLHCFRVSVFRVQLGCESLPLARVHVQGGFSSRVDLLVGHGSRVRKGWK